VAEMKCVLIVQARMTSSRLPGKVLADVAGRPMLQQQLARLACCRLVDEIVVATTRNASDDPVAALAEAREVSSYRGDEDDVLLRMLGAAEQARADVVVRITGDCPLIDPGVVDRVIAALLEHTATCDYASNVVERTFPRGLDAEAFFMDTLRRCDRMATTKRQREHVTLLPRVDRKELFVSRHVTDPVDRSNLRWTVDTEKDLEMVRAIYEGMGLGDRVAGYQEILEFLDAHPELLLYDGVEKTWDPNPR
jgi:spore coat polysaccharide biosynthesis protein SpsF